MFAMQLFFPPRLWCGFVSWEECEWKCRSWSFRWCADCSTVACCPYFYWQVRPQLVFYPPIYTKQTNKNCFKIKSLITFAFPFHFFDLSCHNKKVRVTEMKKVEVFFKTLLTSSSKAFSVSLCPRLFNFKTFIPSCTTNNMTQWLQNVTWCNHMKLLNHSSDPESTYK